MTRDIAGMCMMGKIPRRRFRITGFVLLLCALTISLYGMCTDVALAGPPGSFARSTPATVRFPALVDVGSKQCIPCKMMEPVLEELKVEYAGVLRVEYIDVEMEPSRAVKLGVRGIPTQIFYDASGKERARHMGYISKESILRKFDQLGIKLLKKETGKRTK